MKYFSIDLETTGLDPEKDQVLMFSGIVEDTEKLLPLNELPHITFIIDYERIEGHPFALHMNAWILKLMKDKEQTRYPVYSSKGRFKSELVSFLTEHFGAEAITLAGKNVGNFDWQFIKKWFGETGIRIRHKMIDPGSVFFNSKEKALFSLPEIKGLCGLDESVTHDAYDDALDVIKVLRSKYTGDEK